MSAGSHALRIGEKMLPAASVILFFLAWQLFVDWGKIPPVYLPSPTAIASTLVRMTLSGSLPTNVGVTLLRVFAGFAVAAFVGVLAGVLMGVSKLFARVLDPWIAALYPLPKISLIPLLMIWLGTGEAYKLAISAITAFFPVVMSTYAGVRQVDRGLMNAAKDLGASPRQIQLKVVIPAALPSIYAGLQLGSGITFIMVVAAEMIGGSSQSGMGYLLITAGQVMETEEVFASLVVLAVIGAVVFKIQEWIGEKVAPWAGGREL